MSKWCWACKPVADVPAEYDFVDAFGDKWPLCFGHTTIWICNEINRHDSTAPVTAAIEEYISLQAEDGIEQLEDMLRGISNG